MLRLLFRANKRLHMAYLLKESFGQLWDCNRVGWARRFFAHWKDALKWQCLESCCNFAAMVESHWDGIEAYCREENKVPLAHVWGEIAFRWPGTEWISSVFRGLLSKQPQIS